MSRDIRARAIMALINDTSWFDRLELHGVPLTGDKGELIHDVSVKVVDHLIDKGII